MPISLDQGVASGLNGLSKNGSPFVAQAARLSLFGSRPEQASRPLYVGTPSCVAEATTRFWKAHRIPTNSSRERPSWDWRLSRSPTTWRTCLTN